MNSKIFEEGFDWENETFLRMGDPTVWNFGMFWPLHMVGTNFLNKQDRSPF